MFGRQALVGLSTSRYGTLTFGRQYDAPTELAAPYSASGWWVPATHIGDSDNFDGSVRINNSIKYRSPTLYGFTMQGMYALSNQAAGGTGGFANNRAWSVAANYVNGPFSVGAGYQLLNHPNSTTNTSGAVGGASTTNGDDYSTVFFYGIDGGVARQQIAGAGGSFTSGALIAALSFSHVQLDYNDGASRRLNNYEGSVRYRISTPLQLDADYVFTDGHASGLPKTNGASLHPQWHQFTLGADYLMSKRTELYVSGGFQIAAGDASTLRNGSYQKIAAIAVAGASSNSRQVVVMSGIRHRF